MTNNAALEDATANIRFYEEKLAAAKAHLASLKPKTTETQKAALSLYDELHKEHANRAHMLAVDDVIWDLGDAEDDLGNDELMNFLNERRG